MGSSRTGDSLRFRLHPGRTVDILTLCLQQKDGGHGAIKTLSAAANSGGARPLTYDCGPVVALLRRLNSPSF